MHIPHSTFHHICFDGWRVGEWVVELEPTLSSHSAIPYVLHTTTTTTTAGVQLCKPSRGHECGRWYEV
jgi:hypothetical protein